MFLIVLVTFLTYRVRVVAGICWVLVGAPADGLSCTTTVPLLAREPAVRARRCEDAARAPARRWRCPEVSMLQRGATACAAMLLAVSIIRKFPTLRAPDALLRLHGPNPPPPRVIAEDGGLPRIRARCARKCLTRAK